MKKFNYIALVALYAGLAACTEEVTQQGQGNDNALTFRISVDDANDLTVTRAVREQNRIMRGVSAKSDLTTPVYVHALVEPRSDEATATRSTTLISNKTGLGDFGVSAYRYNPVTQTVASVHANMFYNSLASQASADIWKLQNTTYYWPADNERLQFFAYYPYNTNSTDITHVTGSSASECGPMALHYKMNSTFGQQTDLMAAASTAGLAFDKTETKTNPVALVFKHALTAIYFKLDSKISPGYIKKVSFEDIQTEGTYTVGNTPHAWSFSSADERGAVALDFTDGGTSLGFNTVTGGSSLTTEPWLLIPQEFTAGKEKIHIEINDGDDGTDINNKHDLYIDLADLGNWEPGTKITYLISTQSINVTRIEGVSYPTSWGTEPFTEYKNTYVADEAIGVFSVNKTTREVVKANVKYTFNGTSWAMDDGLTRDEKLLFDDDYEYYAYYPYKATLDGARNAGTGAAYTFAGNTATEFFSDVINQWPIEANQGTAGQLLRQDLHIGKAVAVAGKLSTVTLPMQHALGLAKITLGEKTFTGNTTFYLSSDPSYTWVGTGPKTIHASKELSGGMVACKSTETKYYYVVRPATATTFTCGVSGTTDTWATTAETVTIGSNVCDGFTAEVGGEYTDFPATTEYTLEIGDLLYADGALSHPEDLIYSTTNYPGRDMVAMVAYLAVNGQADPVCENKRHAMAIALKDAGYGRWGTKGTNENDTYFPNKTSSNSNVLIDYGGKARTDYILSSSDTHTTHQAFELIRDYGVVVSGIPNCTGWFMGTTGQWYEISKSMGKLTSLSLHNWQTSNVYSNINAYLAKAGAGCYEGLKTENSGLYWTSTEWDADWTWFVQFTSTRFRIGATESLDNKNLSHYVRPFLAF